MEIIGTLISGLIIVLTIAFCFMLVYIKLRKRKPTEIPETMKILLAKHLELQAECAHEIWSHWIIYQISICETDDNGNVIIPQEKVERWQRLAQTKYLDLSEQEKKSDRSIAEEFIQPLLAEHLEDIQ